jgi:uncharacterized protein (DUF1330 family)
LSHYFIAQIDIHDPEEYQKYIDTCDEVFVRYNGEYLAVDGNPTVLEGDWGYTRIVIIRFPNEKEFERWYNSPEYQDILKYRLKAAHCDSLLVRGRDG